MPGLRKSEDAPMSMKRNQKQGAPHKQCLRWLFHHGGVAEKVRK